MISPLVVFIILEVFSESIVNGKGNTNDTYVWKIAGMLSNNYMTFDESQTKITGGVLFAVFDAIRIKLNFSYSLVKPIKTWYGGQFKNGTLHGWIGQIIAKEADMGFLPIFVTYERSLLMDYPLHLKTFPIIFLIKAPEKLPNWNSITRPFSFKMWICIFLSIILFGVVLHQVIKKNAIISKTPISCTQSKIFWYLFSTYTYQGIDMSPFKRFPSRLLIGIWWFAVIVLVSSYSGILMSYLTYPLNEEVPTTFEELITAVQKGHYSCGTLRGDGVTEYLLGAKSGNAKFFGDYLRSTDNLFHEYEIMEQVENKRFAFIYIDYLIDKLLEKTEDPNKFATSKDTLATFYSAYSLRKGFPYKNNLNKIIIRLSEAGIIDKTYEESRRIQVTSGFRALTLEDFFSPFLLLISGYVVSSICLFLELLLVKKIKKAMF